MVEDTSVGGPSADDGMGDDVNATSPAEVTAAVAGPDASGAGD